MSKTYDKVPYITSARSNTKITLKKTNVVKGYLKSIQSANGPLLIFEPIHYKNIVQDRRFTTMELLVHFKMDFLMHFILTLGLESAFSYHITRSIW